MPRVCHGEGRDSNKGSGWLELEYLEHGGIKLRHWLEQGTKYVQEQNWQSFDSKHVICHVTCVVNKETGAVDARWPMISLGTDIGSFQNLVEFRSSRVILQMADDATLRACAPTACHAFITERVRDILDNYAIMCNGGMVE